MHRWAGQEGIVFGLEVSLKTWPRAPDVSAVLSLSPKKKSLAATPQSENKCTFVYLRRTVFFYLQRKIHLYSNINTQA